VKQSNLPFVPVLDVLYIPDIKETKKILFTDYILLKDIFI
jgi:hypothetical protein